MLCSSPTASSKLFLDRRHLCRLVLILSCAKVSLGFLSPPKNEVFPRSSCIRRLSKNDEANESYKKELKKRKRYVDFPSFVYNTKRESPDRQNVQVLIKVRKNGGAVRTTPRDVPMPQQVNGDRSNPITSWIRKIASELVSRNNPINGISEVTRSAKKSRLLKERSYARKEIFAEENLLVPPSLDDLSPPPSNPEDSFWISNASRALSFFAAYLTFPYVTQFLDKFLVTMPPEELEGITNQFAPGISILYGTFISLTLSILYKRQRDIQEDAATESALITMMLRNLLSLFRNNRELAIEAGQCAADQIRTLVRGSRGAELMLLMYSDPYARLQELLDRRDPEIDAAVGLLGSSRELIKDLYRIRAKRLSDEAAALPPTHFFILNILTVLILLGYTISILPTVNATGSPSNESALLFGVLTAVYVLFYNFANDLNSPFQGVYQVRRSSIASHLLEAKWLIANHPLLRGEVDFEEVEEAACGEVLIKSPGLGDLWFEKDEIFLDSDVAERRRA